MQISILNGIYTDSAADFRTRYPLNLVPVPKAQGISAGYLRTADGMVEFSMSAFTDRGGINWNETCYRVAGKWLVKVGADQVTTFIGELANDGKRAIMVNGFDRLAIASGGKLYYYTPISGLVQQVTDPDLGTVIDVVWAAGYYVTTDGENIVATDLNDPFSVNPLKYGSSEAAPDPVNSLLYIRNEVYAVNRYTIEVFQNIGGTGFPFQRIEGAMVPKGSIGTHASCYFGDQFAFVGSGQNESLSVYLGGPGMAEKIATREIETILQGYTQEQLTGVFVEARFDKMHQWLHVHLPDRTMVYDRAASAEMQMPVWFELRSGASGELPYRARNYVTCYGKCLFGDIQTNAIGYYTSEDARQFGQAVPWEFDTAMIYNEGRGAIIHDLELVRLPGRQSSMTLYPEPTTDTTIALSYSDDGLTYSMPRFAGAARPGKTDARATWRKCGRMRHYRTLRLRGIGNPYPDAFARLEAVVEGLSS